MNKKLNLQTIKRTGVNSIPSLFTMGNMACGFFSILATVEGNFYKAGWLILAALVLDGLDGRIARMLHAESSFGVEMDSLADLLSFCTAPALLMYFMALKSLGVFGAAIAFIYALFGAIRLAKFNAMAYAGTGSKKYFSGLPSPAPAALLASFAISYTILTENMAGSNFKLLEGILPVIYNIIGLIMVLLAVLMVSTIPYAAFKNVKKTEKKFNVPLILLSAFVVFLLIKHPQDVVFIFFSAYVVAGLVMVLYRMFKNMKD